MQTNRLIFAVNCALAVIVIGLEIAQIRAQQNAFTLAENPFETTSLWSCATAVSQNSFDQVLTTSDDDRVELENAGYACELIGYVTIMP